ncbi:hypothetical protein [Pseudomonas brassicacearum]|uniref:hypothetical protein n=1 Tax=Pseudomonas brassicacearum TaxID=930166 RepID=UPI001610735E|nr:hypothetical protein [Pseudomonas brassicacearum]
MGIDIGRKSLTTLMFCLFWIMFAIAMLAFNQRDEARKIHAELEGKSLVCRIEERH